jgi:NAD(P)H-binding
VGIDHSAFQLKTSTVQMIARIQQVAATGHAPSPQRVASQVVDYEDIATTLPASAFAGTSTVFYCLGSTRKDAGSASNFVHIDLGYLQSIAPLCKEAGVQHFSLVSSQGASASSPFLYMKTKGQVSNVAVCTTGMAALANDNTHVFECASTVRPCLCGPRGPVMLAAVSAYMRT